MQRWTRIGEFALTDDLLETEATRGPMAHAMLGLLREDSIELQDLRRFLWELGHFDIDRMNPHQVLATLDHCLSTGMVSVLPWTHMREILFTPRSSQGQAEGDADGSVDGSALASAPAKESKRSAPPTPKTPPKVVIPENWADEAPDEKPPEPQRVAPSSSTLAASLTDPGLNKLLAEKWGTDQLLSSLAKKRADAKLDQLLSDEEYLAIRAYTTNLYAQINPALRNDTAGDWQSLVAHAASGMTKMAQNGYAHQGQVWRRAKFDEAEILRLFPTGSVAIEKGFFSTSYGGPVFSGNTEFRVISKSGVHVESLSDYPEREILFKPGTRFQVLATAYDPLTDMVTIDMEEVL